MPNSVPIGSVISRLTMLMAIGTGWPARRLRTIMSSASGNCAANLPCRRPRKKRSTKYGSAVALNSAAATASTTLSRNTSMATNATTLAMTMIDEEAGEADGEPGLQDQPVERDEAEPVIAARGQPALAPQLDQHAFAIGAGPSTASAAG